MTHAFKRSLFTQAGCCITALLAASSIRAATISWSPATSVVDDSDVVTSGAFHYAEHWGGADGTVNGVAFTAAGTHVVKSGGNEQTLSWTQGTLSAAYYGILRGNWYNANSGSTVTLKSLESGHTYQIQIWAMDKRYSTSQCQNISGGPSLSIGTGQYTIGTFTADAATQVLTCGSGSAGILNAVQVRDISNVIVGPVDAGTSTVTVSPASIPADGATAATVTVTLKDADGNRVPGKTVTLASSRGTADVISAASGPSSAAGVVTFAVKSSTEGSAVFSATDATDGNRALAQTAAVTVLVVGSHGPQASPDPIVFDQVATNDNLVVLMAAASEYSEGLNLYYSGASAYPKHFWFKDFNSSAQFMKWNVSLATGAVYHVYAKLSSGASVPLQLSVEGANTVLSFTTRSIGWDRLDAGTISLPSGTSKLVLRRVTPASDNIEIVSLELIREADLPAYEQRVAAFRADTTWLSQSKYGLMTQYGPWGYPPSGAKKSLEEFANGFDVARFVNTVTNTGARYVIFSMTWYTYQMLAPIQSVDTILGHSNRTSTRDVVGELAAALHQVGVRFMLYYHEGHDGHLGYDSTDWWRAQQWPDQLFTERGSGDRSTFFTNWINVVTEIGNRYGTNLDGFFFDDGMTYYPAPFERLGQAAKAGNPNRLVSYNSWIAARYTDFQEMIFGEGDHGSAQMGSAPAGGNGLFTDGAHKGLLQHGMFVMEQDWGVNAQNQPIITKVSSSQAIAWVRSASSRNVPLSFNMMFWEDQTYSQASMDVLTAVKAAMVTNQTTQITWSQATNVSGDSDVATNGTLLYAEHWAGVDATVNGVTFAAAQSKVVGAPGSSYETLTPSNGYPQGALSTAYWNILRGKWYNAVGTVTLKALKPGHTYLVQVWASDPRYGSSQVETISDGLSLSIKVGQYALGTFTADAATKVINVGGDGVLNAFQVRDITRPKGTVTMITDLAVSPQLFVVGPRRRAQASL